MYLKIVWFCTSARIVRGPGSKLLDLDASSLLQVFNCAPDCESIVTIEPDIPKIFVAKESELLPK